MVVKLWSSSRLCYIIIICTMVVLLTLRVSVYQVCTINITIHTRFGSLRAVRCLSVKWWARGHTLLFARDKGANANHWLIGSDCIRLRVSSTDRGLRSCQDISTNIFSRISGTFSEMYREADIKKCHSEGGKKKSTTRAKPRSSSCCKIEVEARGCSSSPFCCSTTRNRTACRYATVRATNTKHQKK